MLTRVGDNLSLKVTGGTLDLAEITTDSHALRLPARQNSPLAL